MVNNNYYYFYYYYYCCFLEDDICACSLALYTSNLISTSFKHSVPCESKLTDKTLEDILFILQTKKYHRNRTDCNWGLTFSY